MRTNVLLPLLILVFLFPVSLAGSSITLSEAYPVLGESMTVMLDGVHDPSGASLWVVYRPNSQTVDADTKPIGYFSDEGKITWTPRAPGIATITVRDSESVEIATLNVAICFSSTPASGILVMVLAGLLLFGGAILSLRLALKKTIAV
jgi:hypothetical protein